MRLVVGHGLAIYSELMGVNPFGEEVLKGIAAEVGLGQGGEKASEIAEPTGPVFGMGIEVFHHVAQEHGAAAHEGGFESNVVAFLL